MLRLHHHLSPEESRESGVSTVLASFFRARDEMLGKKKRRP
jgi:hypothetical protein